MTASPDNFVCVIDDDALFRVSGDDTRDFLHSQLAGDVRDLTGFARDLAYCNPKGRVLALACFFERDGDVHLALPADAAEASLQRLRMMVLRSKVRFERADEGLARLGVAGSEGVRRLGDTLGMPLPAPGGALESEGWTLLGLPGLTPRVELLGESGRVAEIRESLEGALPAADVDLWRLADVRAGRPRIHAASVESHLPQFLNLEILGGVSFDKGCFPGQEVVARTHYLGKVVRRTRRARVPLASPPEPGTALRAVSGEKERDGGRVLYGAPADGAAELLAVVPVDALDGGADFRLGSAEGPALEWLDLPYATT